MASNITIYGASWCGPCQQAKKYLDDHGVKFTYIDIDENPESMPEGYQSIPVIQIGDEYQVGFNKQSMNQALYLNDN